MNVRELYRTHLLRKHVLRCSPCRYQTTHTAGQQCYRASDPRPTGQRNRDTAVGQDDFDSSLSACRIASETDNSAGTFDSAARASLSL